MKIGFCYCSQRGFIDGIAHIKFQRSDKPEFSLGAKFFESTILGREAVVIFFLKKNMLLQKNCPHALALTFTSVKRTIIKIDNIKKFNQ